MQNLFMVHCNLIAAQLLSRKIQKRYFQDKSYRKTKLCENNMLILIHLEVINKIALSHSFCVKTKLHKEISNLSKPNLVLCAFANNVPCHLLLRLIGLIA